MNYNLRL